ncbi:MAG: 16S rRNA (cytosine(1402)-N(4))-methyltransferase, partial [Candidatus Kapaibacterium sp.]
MNADAAADTVGVDKRREDAYHIPVMLHETLEWLMTDPEGLYVDGTLGGGGHAAGILRKVRQRGRLVCFDADRQAIDECRGAFADELGRGEESRLRIVHANYS